MNNPRIDVNPRAIKVNITGEASVSALFLRPPAAFTCFIFAHGAGAGMDHAFMNAMSNELAAVNIATLRYQFPYMEADSRRPDRPAVCHATVRSAVNVARKELGDMPLIAGGKSFGGRMTSQAQALQPLPGVAGLAFLGFPWHSANKPSASRSEHLDAIRIPMFFMQGGRDTLGDPALVKVEVGKRRETATLLTVPEADHGFHVRVKSGRTDGEIQNQLARAFAAWAASVI